MNFKVDSPLGPLGENVLSTAFRCTCGADLALGNVAQNLACVRCGDIYPLQDGIASFIADGARTALDDIDYDAVYRIDSAASMAFAQTYLDLLGERLRPTVDSYLEIGAGTGQFTLGFMHLRQPKQAVITDISTSMLQVCRDRLRANGINDASVAFATWDGRDCLKAGAHDLVAGFSVLHHVLDYPAMLRKIQEALRPGGIAVFLEPNYRFHLAMVEMICEILVVVQDSSEWSPKDRQHLADWLYENNTNIRFRGDDRMLAGREDKHLFDGDQLREAMSEAGFDSIELIAAEDESFSALDVYSRQMRLSRAAREDLLTRYARLLPGAYGHVSSEDLGASSLIVLHKPLESGAQTGPATHLVKRITSVAEWNRHTRCELVFSNITEGSAERSDMVGIQCQGWMLGDVDIKYVALRQARREWLFPVHRHRADVHSALNANRAYPLRRSLFSGIDHIVLQDPPGPGVIEVYAMRDDDHATPLGPIVFDTDTGIAAIYRS